MYAWRGSWRPPGCAKISQMTLDINAWATESNPLSATITNTALSRTGEDSSLLRNRHDKSRRGMPHRSCFTRLQKALGHIGAGDGRPPAEAQSWGTAGTCGT